MRERGRKKWNKNDGPHNTEGKNKLPKVIFEWIWPPLGLSSAVILRCPHVKKEKRKVVI